MGRLVLFQDGLDLQVVEPRVGLLLPFGRIAGTQIGATESALLFVRQAGGPVEEAVFLVGLARRADLFAESLMNVGWKTLPFPLIAGVARTEFFNGKGRAPRLSPLCVAMNGGFAPSGCPHSLFNLVKIRDGMPTFNYDTSMSDIVNSIIVQFYLIATIVVLLLIGTEPRSSLVPGPLKRVFGIAS
jgi:hypothetical protein